MIVAALTFIIGSIFLRETHGHKIWDEIDGSNSENAEAQGAA